MASRLTVLGALAAAMVLPAPALAHELGTERRSLASLPALPAAPASADEPDLRISLPSVPYDGQVAPVYLDAYTVPGRLLYRFDSMIHNTGGALDLYGDDGEVVQAIWPGGAPDPSTPPRPGERAPAGQVSESDRGASGASFEYVFEETHDHWHFFSAARYSLLVPGAPARVSEKVGFCMYDSFGDPDGETWWFPDPVPGGSWCGFSDPDSTFVRMGLSRGATDRYSAQREFQYVDVTGLAPGSYVLRAEANPHGHVVEGDLSDNLLDEQRAIPGVRADGAAATVESGRSVAVALPAEALVPEVPARAAASCNPVPRSRGCYDWPSEAPLQLAIADGPAHGAVTVAGGEATYTPAAGFTGTDRFTYTATDARELTSEPAAVEVRVTPASPAAPSTGVPPVIVDPAPRRLLSIGHVRRAGPRAITVRLRCLAAAAGTCAGRAEARIGGRRAGRRRYSGIGAGAVRSVRIRLARPLRRGRAVTIRATVRDATGAGLRAHRTLPVR